VGRAGNGVVAVDVLFKQGATAGEDRSQTGRLPASVQ